MLMMNTMKTNATALPGWAKKDIQAMIAFMIRFDKELRATGKLVSAEGLTFPNEAKLVRAGKDGKPIVEEAFPEGKNFSRVIGLCMSTALTGPTESPARASAAPGKDGVPTNMPIEVRPVGSPPPEFE
jgi:hypothetical protein